MQGGRRNYTVACRDAMGHLVHFLGGEATTEVLGIDETRHEGTSKELIRDFGMTTVDGMEMANPHFLPILSSMEVIGAHFKSPALEFSF